MTQYVWQAATGHLVVSIKEDSNPLQVANQFEDL